MGLATAQLYPQVNLSASIATESLTVRDLFDPAGLVWSVAAGLTQPLFDAGLRRAQRRAALALLQAAAADYQQTILHSFQQVADLLEALSHDSELQAAQRRALDAATRNVSLQRANYERGGIGLLDLLDAQRQYSQALSGSIKAEGQRDLDTTALLAATAGAGAEEL